MKAPDLSKLFGPKKGSPDMDEPDMDEDMPMEDTEETSSALDSAIDEVFDSSDPVARREAFKSAIRLCKEGDY